MHGKTFVSPLGFSTDYSKATVVRFLYRFMLPSHKVFLVHYGLITIFYVNSVLELVDLLAVSQHVNIV